MLHCFCAICTGKGDQFGFKPLHIVNLGNLANGTKKWGVVMHQRVVREFAYFKNAEKCLARYQEASK